MPSRIASQPEAGRFPAAVSVARVVEIVSQMQKEKILFVSPQPFFCERGSPYRVRAEVTALVAQGFEVDLLTYPLGREVTLPGVRLLRSLGIPGVKEIPIGWSWRKLLMDFFLFWRMFFLMLKNRYCALHGVEEAGVMAAVLGGIFRVPFVFDMHSQMSEQLCQCVLRPGGGLHRALVALERWCMRRAAGIITVSDVITARVRSIAPLVPAMTVEDLPLDFSEHVQPDRVEKLREELRLHDAQAVVYTGNFEPYQGMDLLFEGFAACFRKLQAAPGLLQRRPRLIVVGGGEQNSPRFRFYREMVERLGISSHVVFAGQQEEAAVGCYMTLAEIAVSPRIAGAHTPLKIYTYMAAAKPIVATNISAHTNVLNDSNAFLAESTAESFADALLSALDESPAGLEAKQERVRNAADLLRRRFQRTEFERRIGVLYRAVRGEYLSDEVLLSPQTLELRQQQQG
jgi:glycosyltransferase involved in cell wall biosynthesis